ncbi:MAG: HAMP domain-containing sensor histidine kinase [Erysipelotrichaceae bacterium]|nr:HAMP domain-containing sensor histidine kinase [Erysipelotrichaceae bacterium]MDD3809105.1 HAMP domain-containing sensor histidine kinase [Erysipelotrichaceae bacterium]
MIKKLQRRFIVIALVSVSVVFVTIMGTLLVSNYLNIVEKASNSIDLIYVSADQLEAGLSYRDSGKKPPTDGLDVNYDFRGPEGIFSSRFFIVKLTDGTVSEVNVDNISAIDQTSAGEMALEVIANEDGVYENYRYKVFDEGSSQTVVFIDTYMEMQSFYEFLSNTAIMGGFGLGMFILVAWFLSKMAIRPLVESIEKQKQFITNASHELKTPLTVISANNEMIELDYGPNNWSQGIERQVGKMNKLTNSLVTLARLDEQDYHVELKEIDLSGLVKEVVDDYRDLALVENKVFECELEPLSLKGNEELLRQLVSILLDNAFKYSNNKGWIKIRLKVGKKKTLIVENSVEEIISGSHDEVFERFTRLEQSRNSSLGGYGVGLAIAKSIVGRHHGKIKAYSEDNNTFTIRIDF